MGNREELLAGAKRCLFDKGFARTRARDIATASGVSLAAIGYHFGSKEALLTEALRDAIAEWGDGVARLLGGGTGFEATWNGVTASFADSGPLWAIQFELLAHLARNPELRAVFADATGEGRSGLAQLVDGSAGSAGSASSADSVVSADSVGSAGAPGSTGPADVGAFYQVLLAGLAAVWLADPRSVPSGADLLAAMRTVVDRA